MASGMEMMFASLLKSLGISPDTIKEGIAKINATASQAGAALQTIVAAQSEILSRLERIEQQLTPPKILAPLILYGDDSHDDN